MKQTNVCLNRVFELTNILRKFVSRGLTEIEEKGASCKLI